MSLVNAIPSGGSGSTPAAEETGNALNDPYGDLHKLVLQGTCHLTVCVLILGVHLSAIILHLSIILYFYLILLFPGMMSAGYMNKMRVRRLFMGACSYLRFTRTQTEERTTMAYVQKVVRDINEKIKPYDMTIKSVSCELTGNKLYIFLVTVEKPLLR